MNYCLCSHYIPSSSALSSPLSVRHLVNPFLSPRSTHSSPLSVNPSRPFLPPSFFLLFPPSFPSSFPPSPHYINILRHVLLAHAGEDTRIYEPCDHEGPCTAENGCVCVANRGHCDKWVMATGIRSIIITPERLSFAHDPSNNSTTFNLDSCSTQILWVW